ncbi:hypothetical protein LQW54_013229 [Pestalotiopsis sp. IQ-011]
MCDVCSRRSRGVQQECQTCTMTTCRKCYNTGNFDRDHDLSLVQGLDWSTTVVDEVEPRRGPIVRHADSDGSLSPQTRAKAAAPKAPYKPKRGNHPDACKKEYGHKELYQTTSKSKENAPVPEDSVNVAEQQASKRKNESAEKQQPVKKKRQDYQLYQTRSKSKTGTPSKGMNYHKEIYQTAREQQPTSEQHADNERVGESEHIDDHHAGDQRASSAPGTGYNHQSGYPPVGHQFPPMPHNMAYDPRTGQYYPRQLHGFDDGRHGMGHLYPQQHHSLDYGYPGMGQFHPQVQQNFAHNDGGLPSLRPLPPTQPQDGFRAPEHAHGAQMPLQRDYFSQQAYHHQMGFQQPSQPQNMPHNPPMGAYYPQDPQHLDYGNSQAGFAHPQAGFAHPPAGYHGPQQPPTFTHHDPRMPGQQQAHDQQSGRHVAVSQPEEDLGSREPQQRRETQRENNTPLHGTPNDSNPDSPALDTRAPLDTDDDFPPVRARQQQRQSARAQSDEDSLFVPEAVPEPQAMNMRMPLQDTDDDFPPLRSRQQQRQRARPQSDEDSLFVSEAVSESQSDPDSLFGQAYEDAHEVSVVGGPEVVQQRAAEHEENPRQSEPPNDGQGGPQVLPQEREHLTERLEDAWTRSPELARVRYGQDTLRGTLAAMELLRNSIMLGDYGHRDAIKAIAYAWVDSLRRTFLANLRY